MRCCRATPSYGDEETSVVAAARSGFCGWGGVLMGATSNVAADNKANGEQQHWANGNGGVGLACKLVDGLVLQQETEYRNNNNNCSTSASANSRSSRGNVDDDAGGATNHTVLQLRLQQQQQQQQQTQQRRPSASGWRSSNRRYSLLRCILCNLKENNTQAQQREPKQQANYQEQIQDARLHSPTPSQPQAIVVAVVVGASIDHQIQQQEPQLTDTKSKQQRRTLSAGGAGVGGVSFCARGGGCASGSGSKSAHNQGGVGVYIDGCREALL